MEQLILSTLGKTWIVDLDGTLVKHNGYKIDGHDTLLDGAKMFLENVKDTDMLIIVTARSEEYREATCEFLEKNKIPYKHIIFNAPYGERILINDKKPSGLNMAYAINTDRDCMCNVYIQLDDKL